MSKPESLEAAERAARKLADIIKPHVPEGWGFTLFLASFGKRGNLTYVSTINREDAHRMIAEWVAATVNDPPTGFSEKVGNWCWCCESREDLTLINGPLRSLVICRRCLTTPGNREAI